MKKSLLLGIFIIICTSLFAQKSTSTNNVGIPAQHETHVTPAQALNVGYAFMRTGDGSKGNGTKSGEVSKQAMQLVYTGQTYDSLTGTTTDCYYVFALQPKGFVIVAADDRVEPILGYSYDNDFAMANMPDHVRGWLNNYERQIEAVTKSNFQAEPATQTKWTRLKSGQAMSITQSGGSVEPLLTTQWDQNWPYNDKCPVDTSGNKCVVGCVAVALGQIMKYHNWPSKGYGHVHYTQENILNTISAIFDTTYYDWQNMPNSYVSSGYEPMAQLLADIGKSLFMYYTPVASSTFEDAQTLADVFNYDYFTMQVIERDQTDEGAWVALIKNELDNSKPVYYRGQSHEDPSLATAHAFVCDGYDDNGLFHFNFGWGGSSDGYYNLSNISAGVWGGFNYYQSILIGIQPSTGITLSDDDTLSGTMTLDESLYCGAFSNITILPGTELKFAPGKGMFVSGGIFVEGTEDEPILITASDTSLGWEGMQIHPSKICYKMLEEPDTLRLNHTTISYSTNDGLNFGWPNYFKYPVTVENVVHEGLFLNHVKIQHNQGIGIGGRGMGKEVDCALITLDSCEISDNGKYGIDLFQGFCNVSNSLIHHNKGAICFYNQVGLAIYDGTSRIINCQIYGNDFGVGKFSDATRVIEFDGEILGNLIFNNIPSNGETQFKQLIRGGHLYGNSIHDNVCDIVIFLRGNMSNNVIYNNIGEVVRPSYCGVGVLLEIFNNLIYNNNGGINITDGDMRYVINNNTIANNNQGISLGQWQALDCPLFNNIIWNNGEKEIRAHECFIISKNNIIKGGSASIEGNNPNNIIINTCDKDPKFVNPTTFVGPGEIPDNVSFELALSSPAIDFGYSDTTISLPTIDIAKYPRINRTLDVGAYENQSDTVHPCFFTENYTIKSCIGSSVDMSMPYRGEQCSFAWFHNDSLIPDSYSDTLHIETVTSNDEGDYYCVISNTIGIDTSSIIHLVLSPQLPGCIEAINGPDTIYHFQQNIPFSINNVLAADKIEWIVSEGLSYSKVSDTSILVSVNQAVDSAFLYVVASNGCGACADTAIIIFTVLPLPGQLILSGDDLLITNCDFSWPCPTVKTDASFHYDNIEWQTPSWLNVASYELGRLNILSSSNYDFDTDTIYARWVINGYGTGDWTPYSMRVFHSEYYGNIVYVTEQGGGRKDGSSWDNAISDLSDGVLVASYLGKKLWVAVGTYHGDGVSESVLTFTRHIEMYGGFAGNENASYDITSRNLSQNASVLDGQNSQSLINVDYFYGPAKSTVDGFVFQHGKEAVHMYYSWMGEYNNDTIRNCIFRHNIDGSMASAVHGGKVVNCLFYENSNPPLYGSYVLNSTIVTNDGDIDVFSMTNSIVCGSRVWGEVNYSAVEAWDGGGDGNILLAHNNDGTSPDSNYVRFVDPENGDFRLAYGSACINAGTPDISALDLPAVDLQGFPRVLNGRIDMGTYEFYTVPIYHEYDTVCEGGSVTFLDSVYAVAGTYTCHISANPLEDTTYVLHLTVNPVNSADFAETACESFEWNGETFITSGDYTRTFTNSSGCDSVVTLHLTVNHSTHNIETETACESYEWNGQTYTSSGDYDQTFTAANGCDSVVTLLLTVNPAETSEFSITTSDSCYTWNSQSYCASGDYTQNLQTVNGCDSVVTLHLTITVGIDDYNLGADMTVYPNPTTGVVNVQCTMNNVQVGAIEFQLFDAFGRLLWSTDGVGANDYSPLRTDEPGLSVQTAQIDLSHYAVGVYFIKAVAEGNVVAVRKVVKR